MSDDDYEYDYDDDASYEDLADGGDDGGEPDVVNDDDNDDALENAYYNAKELRETDPSAAAEAFEEVMRLEREGFSDAGEGGPWSFRALKQLVKLRLRSDSSSARATEAYGRLLECASTGRASPSAVERGVGRMLERVASLRRSAAEGDGSARTLALARDMFEATVRVFHPKTGKSPNRRLWLKAGLKHGRLLCETDDTAGLRAVVRDLLRVASDDGADGAGDGGAALDGGSEGSEGPWSGTDLTEIYALQLQLCRRTDDDDDETLREVFHKATRLRGGIPHPRTLALVHEIGGEMHATSREFEAAGEAFFQAFKSYDEAGDPARLRCLKYFIVTLMLNESGVDPFDHREARPYQDDPEIAALTTMARAFRSNDIETFEDMLKRNEGNIMDDEFVREHVADLPGMIKERIDTRDLLGVSVHHLKNVFLSEVLTAGHSRDSKICEIEPLEEGTDSVIRSKGVDKVSPVDSEIGASYVHSLQGRDHVGKATFMLSYSWGYTIGDIVDTLMDYCSSRQLDPKRTYVWICCLCVNQHRVLQLKNDQKKSGMAADTKVDFFSEFGRRVTGIGRVLAMMAPWEEPEYLKRVWCVFEIFSANQNEDCHVDIVMPPDQQRSLEEAIVGEEGKIDALYDVFAKTKVQHAKASVESDRRAILGMVEKDPGHDALNHRVNEWLRAWVADSIDKAAEKREQQSQNPATDLALGWFYFNVGGLLKRSGEYERAMDMFQQSLAINEVVRGTDHKDTAAAFFAIGSVLKDQGKLEEALVKYRKALAIQESALGKDHPDTAATYNNMGLVLWNQGGNEEALAEYRKALAIKESALGKDHPSTAATYGSIGAVLHNQGRYEEALVQYRKALAIKESALGKDHPSTATTYHNIGSVLRNQGKYEEALVVYRRALAIRESALGKDHPETAVTYNNIGTALAYQGQYEAALVEYRKALRIFETVLGRDHPQTKGTKESIDAVNECLSER